jgi:uncharacterized protein (TIGR02453 family)
MRSASSPRKPAPFFGEALFAFLRELKVHNEREWFLANKERFEAEVRQPMLAFIMAFADPLQRLNEHYLADPRPSGGSMFRIFRDARFSKDKSPYKTNVGAQFRHRECSKDVHAPGFYLHLEPGGCFISAGLWHPDPDSLRKVRERIVSHGKEWQAMAKTLAKAGLEVQGDSLKRVPQGFDPQHPLAEALKLKDFYTGAAITQKEVCAPDFLDQFTAACRQNLPLMAFLTKALDLPW